MNQLRLIYKDSIGYVPETKINSAQLGILWELMCEIPVKNPDWLISDLSDQSLTGMDIIEFDYEGSDVIISNQFESYDEGGPCVRIKKDKLLDFVGKYVQLATKKTSKIFLACIDGEYSVHEG